MKGYKAPVGVQAKPVKLKHKNWIQGAIKHPGALHAELGVKKGTKIPTKKLASAAKKGGKLGMRARLAQTLKKLHHKKGQSMEGIAKTEQNPAKSMVKGVKYSRKMLHKSKMHKKMCKKHKKLHCTTC